MRRFISALMILCLLHVTTYGAVAELAEITHTSHATVPIPAGANPKSYKTLYQSIQHTLSELGSKVSESSKSVASYVTSHPIVWVPLATVAMVVLFISVVSIVMDFMLGTFPGSSIVPNFEGILHWLTHPSNHHKVLDYTPDYSQSSNLHRTLVQRDGWKSGLHLPLPEAVQAWFNSANNILTLASGIALQYRHNEHPSTEALQAFSDAAALVFDTHSAVLFSDIACDLTIGAEPGQDRLSNCHDAQRPANWDADIVNADAQVWFLRHRLNFDAAHLLPHTERHTPKYPKLDVSPNYKHVTPELRAESRRMLLQARNFLSQEEALKDWLTNAGHWITLATEITNLLRTGGCPNASTPTALNGLTRTLFDAHQAQLTNGTLRCDMDINTSGVDVTGCTPDTEPKDYDHTANCPNVRVKIEQDAAIWLIPGTGTTNYHTFLLSANPAPAPHTPTATQEANTRTHTRKIPNTPTDTRKPSESLSHTPPKSESMTLPEPTRPGRNTTSRLYWANWDPNPAKCSIWWATINQTSGDLINPQLFVQGGFLGKIGGLHVDEQNGFVYWGLQEDKGIFRARLQTSPPRLYDNVTLLSTADTDGVQSMYLEAAGQKLHWLSGAVLNSASLDPENPTVLYNVQKLSTNPNSICSLSAPGGLYVNSTDQKVIVSCPDGDIYQFDFNPATIALSNKTRISPTSMPTTTIKALSASPELGRVFMRDTTARILGGGSQFSHTINDRH